MIGKLRKRVLFYEIEQGQPDGIGGYLTSESTKTEIWANVQQLNAHRALQFQTITNEQPMEFTIRFNAYPVKANTLIDFNGDTFTVHSVVDDLLNKIHQIVAWL